MAKRPLGKIVAPVLWFAGSCTVVLWVCWWIFAMIVTKKFHVGAIVAIAVSLLITYEGFSIFNAVRKSQ